MDNSRKQPYFSVLVPVYNVEQFLHACVQSVFKQDFTDFELILVDDGSTDSSGEICDCLEKEHPQVRVIHQKNTGLLSARRAGIRAASGSHIVFLDSDDYLAEGTLSVLHRQFEESGCDGVFYGWQQVDDGKLLDSGRITEQSERITDKRDLYRKCLLNWDFNSLCIKSVSRNVFDGRDYSSWYHVQSGEDLLQSIEILKNCRSVMLIPDLLYFYRKNTSSITRAKHFETYDLDMSVQNEVLKFLESEEVFTEADYRELRNFNTRNMLDTVVTVCRSAESPERCTEYLDLIRSGEFYQRFILPFPFTTKDLGLSLPLYLAFRNGRYAKVRLLVKLYDSVRKRGK